MSKGLGLMMSVGADIVAVVKQAVVLVVRACLHPDGGEEVVPLGYAWYMQD